MNIEMIETDNNAIIVKVIEKATINNIETLQQQFIDIFSKYDSITIDTTELSECDLTFIQFLIAAKKTAITSNAKLYLDRQNSAVASVIERTGAYNLNDEAKMQDSYISILFSTI